MDADQVDARFMDQALRLARRGLGIVWPNPAVGCVLTDADGGRVLGRGWTQIGGRPHAETRALEQAASIHGAAALKGATAYVTLEPCRHRGRTPPCTKALIEAGIGRVVVPCQDPDPRVSGRGLAALGEAGIEVDEGIRRDAAMHINAGFFARVVDGRPLVTLKTATTLDGRIATHSWHSQWITGPLARRRSHLMRAEHDAVMVGAETAIRDNPKLTCRLPGLEDHSPIRVVVDSRLRLPLTAELVADAAENATYLVTVAGGDRLRRKAFTDAGVAIIEVPQDFDGRVDLSAALAELAELGVTRLLVEGGAELAASMMRADLIDRIAWFRAPSIIGGDGLATIGALGVDQVDMARRWHLADATQWADDVLETYERMA